MGKPKLIIFGLVLGERKAISEAKKYCKVNVSASSEADKFTTIPPFENWSLNSDAAYVHYTPNETIGGVEFHWIPDTGGCAAGWRFFLDDFIPSIQCESFWADLCGCAKNIGPAGVTLVIVRDDLIGNSLPTTPSVFDYAQQAERIRC